MSKRKKVISKGRGFTKFKMTVGEYLAIESGIKSEYLQQTKKFRNKDLRR
jgi:hypothetical protein